MRAPRRIHRFRTAPIEGDDGLDLVGFLADNPELADEIQKIATLERAGALA